ncbi:4-phosphopantoate--beta-alanine ligase, partial [Rubrivirga sp.]|uniref:4-phosphopantoate--beta-alanine ligase n=1 Tax=Rubrivirga sp. TaxID=1885344 RepID=UPI003C770953
FAPSPQEMYPFGLPPFATVSVRDLDRHLCGASRPGHFQGVTTVVTKLLLACRPHVAVFGQKDAQQLAIIRRMVAELGFGLEVVGHPIVREADGLAMSSRNRYLSPEERKQAIVLSQAIRAVESALEAGERSVDALRRLMRETLQSAPLVRPDYLEVVDADTLEPAVTLSSESPSDGRYLVAVAAFVGDTRLIDNTTLVVGD